MHSQQWGIRPPCRLCTDHCSFARELELHACWRKPPQGYMRERRSASKPCSEKTVGGNADEYPRVELDGREGSIDIEMIYQPRDWYRRFWNRKGIMECKSRGGKLRNSSSGQPKQTRSETNGEHLPIQSRTSRLGYSYSIVHILQSPTPDMNSPSK